MNRHVRQLERIISSVEPRDEVVLSPVQERIFRSLKTTGERATKGRLVSKTIFEAKDKDGTAMLMIMEGRHAMSVARQVARRFEQSRELKFADAIKTRHGAYVILRTREETE